MKLTGERVRVRNYRWTDSKREANVKCQSQACALGQDSSPALAGGRGDLRCSGVPPGKQEKCGSRVGVSSFSPLSPPAPSCLLPSPGRGRGRGFCQPSEVLGWVSAFIFLVYLLIQLLGLKMFQTVCSATHDFIWGFHKPEQKPLSWLLPDDV